MTDRRKFKSHGCRLIGLLANRLGTLGSTGWERRNLSILKLLYGILRIAFKTLEISSFSFVEKGFRVADEQKADRFEGFDEEVLVFVGEAN